MKKFTERTLDSSQLETTLVNAKIQTENNALYQTIKGLINKLGTADESIATLRGTIAELESSVEILSAGSSGSSSSSTSNGSIKRVIAVGETLTILDKYSLVVAVYYSVFGNLLIQGDGALEVL